MYCNQCGKQIPDGSRFCNFCGMSLTAVQSMPQPAAVQSDPYFDIRHGVLVKYKGREKNVVVPAGVVEIEKNAFTGYDMESITIPEGCRKVHIDTFVKTIRFPTTIEDFSLDAGGYIPNRCADHIYFASGTKKIKGRTRGYCVGSSLRVQEHGPKMKLHIPSTVEDIRELQCGHYVEGSDNNYYFCDPLIYDDINAFSGSMRRQIYQMEGRCSVCGGYIRTTLFGNKKCESCGKTKDYIYNYGRLIQK